MNQVPRDVEAIDYVVRLGSLGHVKFDQVARGMGG